MRYIQFHLDNGFAGCDLDIVCAYSDETTDDEIIRIFDELNEDNAYGCLDLCVDDPSDEEEVNTYFEELLGSWDEISEDEYLELVADGVEEFVNGEDLF